MADLNPELSTEPRSQRVHPRKGERVAVLDMKNHKLTTLDKAAAEVESHEKVNLPRWKSKTTVYLPEGTERKYVGTVHLMHLGFGYNIHRLFGAGGQLYVLID